MSNDIVPYAHRYLMPPYLHRQVSGYLLLSDTLPEGSDMLDRPTVSYSPEAADAAVAMRAERQPAPPAVIGRWLTDLGHATAPLERDALRGRIGMVVRVLGTLPAFCWNEDTLALAASRFTHYPAVAELAQVLKPIAERHERELRHVEAMSRASQNVGYRESTVPYVLPPPPPPSKPRLVEDNTVGRPDLNIQPPRMTPEEQIRALGLDPKDFPRKTDGAA
jgi:hypothetical protein